MTASRTRRAAQHRRTARRRRIAAAAITAAIALAFITGNRTDNGQERQMPKAEQPYCMTEEYQEMKQEEQRRAEEEANAMLARMEEYRQRQEAEAQRVFEEAREHGDDGGADGFIYYDIPEEFKKSGGSLPESVQRHLYEECMKNGIAYSDGLGLIEQESGYKADAVGEDGDSGYTQWIPRFQKDSMEELGVTDPLDPKGNITIGMRKLGELRRKYGGNMAKALTAYNSGCAGAYRNYFSAGQDASPYAKAVMERSERIEKELELEG